MRDEEQHTKSTAAAACCCCAVPSAMLYDAVRTSNSKMSGCAVSEEMGQPIGGVNKKQQQLIRRC